MEQLGEIHDRLLEYDYGGDYSYYIICAIVQKLRDNGVSRESAWNFLKLREEEDAQMYSMIYDEGDELINIKMSEYYQHSWITKYQNKKFWENIEAEIDRLLEKAYFESAGVIEYKMDSNNSIIIDTIEKIVYEETESQHKNAENFKRMIIGAIPTKVTIYKNPFIEEVIKYEIEWETKTGIAPIKMKAMPSNQVYDYLKDQNLVLDSRRGKDVLTRTLFMMERKGNVKVDMSITKQGIFFNPHDEKIMSRDIDIKTDATFDEEEEAIEFLESYEQYFHEQNKKLATVLKWGWMSAYSFVIKQLNYEWIPWLYLYGKAGSGKTEGYGFPVLYMYSVPNEQLNDKGGSSIDTVARLGQAMEESTLPTLVNEPGTLFKKPSTCDMLKNCVTSKTSRAKFYDFNKFSIIPAYNIMFLTGNQSMPNDESLRRRFIIMNCSRNENTRDSRNVFNEEVKPTHPESSPLNSLKVISGYIYNHIIKEPDLLSDWKYCIDSLLEQLWLSHGRKIPSWLSEWMEAETLEDIDNDKRDLIREDLKQMIIDKFTEHTRRDINGVSLCSVLEDVIETKSIAWLDYKNKQGSLKDHEVAFSTGFVHRINRLYAEEETLKDIAQLLDWDYAKQLKCFNSSGIFITVDNLLHFLFPNDCDNYYPNCDNSEQSVVKT